MNAGGADVTPPEADEEEGIDIATIGIYTGGAILAILLIFILVMAIEKCRRKNKRITEVVEFKPFDLDAHYKGIETRKREAAKNGPPRGKPKPARTPVPIMQKIHGDDKDDLDNSSRGASRYQSNEVDLSSKRALNSK